MRRRNRGRVSCQRSAAVLRSSIVLRETWCVCYVSWKHKKNNEANTMVQVGFLRQSGKKARTKFSVLGPIGICFDVLVSFHEPLRERPTLVLACAEIKNHFAKVKGTGKINLLTRRNRKTSTLEGTGMKSPSKPSDPTRVPFLCRPVRWAVGLEPTQQVTKEERGCARPSRRISLSGDCSKLSLRSCMSVNAAGPIRATKRLCLLE